MYQHQKRCAKCKQNKALNEFFKSKKSPDQRQSWCKECMKQYSSSWSGPTQIPTPPDKFCKRCLTFKPASEFHQNKISRDGLHTICKVCRKLKALERMI